MNTLSCSSSKASYYIYDNINQINEQDNVIYD